MVCEVCSVDREDDPVIRDYPRFLRVQKPCPNCGIEREPEPQVIDVA